jgi:uncharacterized protein YkwD
MRPTSLVSPVLVAAIGVSLIAFSLWAAPAANPSAGSVKALLPAASRNAQPMAVNDALQWNDVLQTDAKGRVRAALNDGSLLSLGSNTQLKVVQHDAASQQTALDLNYGKLRNQVTKITQPQGKYQVKTSNAVIGVIGTDFYVGYDKGRTTIICYEGRVSVSPLNEAKVLGSTNAPVAPDGSVTLHAGHVVIIGPPIARDETLLYPVLMQQSQDDTDITGTRTDATIKPEDEAQMVDMINQTRGLKGVPPLMVDPRLTDAARKHTWIMIDAGAISHQFPGEPTLSDRLGEVNVPFDSAGENLGWDVDVVATHQSLLEDPPHLKNIMDPKFNVVGVAVIRSGDHVYVTEDFAHIGKQK